MLAVSKQKRLTSALWEIFSYYFLLDIEPFEKSRDIAKSKITKELIMNRTKPELNIDIIARRDDPSVMALMRQCMKK